jgi:hypothetical protein
MLVDKVWENMDVGGWAQIKFHNKIASAGLMVHFIRAVVLVEI